MRPSRLFTQCIVFVVAGVYLVSFLIQGLPTESLFAPIGAAGAAASLAVLLFDHYLWRAPKLGRWVSKRPDLRGTWRGVLSTQWVDPRTGQRKPPDTEVYFVIRQTFWQISGDLLTMESRSCSAIAAIEREGSHYKFVAQYRNVPRVSKRPPSTVHHGSFTLDIAGEPVDRLEGFYWTDRCTMGELEFDRRSPKAVDSFAHARQLSFGHT